MTLGREEGGVGFDHQSIEGDATCGFAQVFTLFERDDSGERDLEAMLHRSLREGKVARIAVENAFDFIVALGDPDV